MKRLEYIYREIIQDKIELGKVQRKLRNNFFVYAPLASGIGERRNARKKALKKRIKDNYKEIDDVIEKVIDHAIHKNYIKLLKDETAINAMFFDQKKDGSLQAYVITRTEKSKIETMYAEWNDYTKLLIELETCTLSLREVR